MRLIHYSQTPLTEVYSVSKNSRVDNFKPEGLWVSVLGEDDWPSWCKEAGYRLDSLKCATEIILAKDAVIKYLRNEKDIDDFTEEYGIKNAHPFPFVYTVHWEKMLPTYQGIIIAPYVWERRLTLHTSWYYGWDCASGCIWDKEAIKEIKPFKETIDADNKDLRMRALC